MLTLTILTGLCRKRHQAAENPARTAINGNMFLSMEAEVVADPHTRGNLSTTMTLAETAAKTETMAAAITITGGQIRLQGPHPQLYLISHPHNIRHHLPQQLS